jgi:hypothetical protein
VGRQQIPHTVADHDGGGDVDAELLCGRHEQVGIGLGPFDNVAGDDHRIGRQ